jgi:hypothetical protein
MDKEERKMVERVAAMGCFVYLAVIVFALVFWSAVGFGIYELVVHI